jgi:hypothetical protein
MELGEFEQGELAPEVRSQIEGDISSTVAAGFYNLEIGSVHGGVINISPEGEPVAKLRTSPLQQLPSPFPRMINRQQEIDRISSALMAVEPVGIFGNSGLGKTSLLRVLVHNAQALQDGVLFLSVKGRSLSDVFQVVFDAFYECDVACKPRESQILSYLQDLQALILLDDLDLEQQDLEALINALPGCSFIFASLEQGPGAEGQAIVLDGLATDDAIALFEQELGNTVADDELPEARELCSTLVGNPLDILRAAGMVREAGVSITETLEKVQNTGDATEALETEILSKLSDKERKALIVLSALDGTPLHKEHINALLQTKNVDSVLEQLEQRKLVQSQDSQYRVTGSLSDTLKKVWDLTSWQEWLVQYLISWGDQQDSITAISNVFDAYLTVLDWTISTERWTEALKLVRIIEGPLALGRWWDAWDRSLQWGLQAAREDGQQSAEAWALHQIGTRALCLGEDHRARESLEAALSLRENLGDQLGAAVSRHNLGVFLGPSPLGAISLEAPISTEDGLSTVAKVILVILGLIGVLGIALVAVLAQISTNLEIIEPPVIAITPNTITPSPTIEEQVEVLPEATSIPTSTSTALPTPIPTLVPSPAPSLTPTVPVNSNLLFDFIEQAPEANWLSITNLGNVPLDFNNEPLDDEELRQQPGFVSWAIPDAEGENLILFTMPPPETLGGQIVGVFDDLDFDIGVGDTFVAQTKLADVSDDAVATYFIAWTSSDPDSNPIVLARRKQEAGQEAQEWRVFMPDFVVEDEGFGIFSLGVVAENDETLTSAFWLEARLEKP